MGREPKHSPVSKMIFDDRVLSFDNIKHSLMTIAESSRNPESTGFDEVELNLIKNDIQDKSYDAGILFDTDGKVQKLDLDKKGSLLLIDPRTGLEFFEIFIDPENKEKPVEMKELSFGDILSRFDAGISKDAPDYELRKNIVLWDKLGSESKKDDVFKSLAKSTPEIKKPHRGFFGTIRDWFGKNNEGRRRYEREKDVYRAKLCNVLETKYNTKNIEYDKDLIDDVKAAEYIKGTKKVPEVNVKNEKEAVSQDQPPVTNEEYEKLKSALMILNTIKKSNDPAARKGALAIGTYIKNNKGPERDALVDFLDEGVERYIVYPNTKKTEDYTKTLNSICSAVGSKGRELMNVDSMNSAVREAAGEISGVKKENADAKKHRTADELEAQSAYDTLEYFKKHENPEVKKGAECVENYIKANNGTVSQAITGYLKDGAFVRSGKTDAPEAQSYIKTFCTICENISKSADPMSFQESNDRVVEDAVNKHIEPETGKIVDEIQPKFVNQ